MWFLTERPDKQLKIECQFVLESKPLGYQETILQLKLQHPEVQSFKIGLPFPYSINKPNGSLRIWQSQIQRFADANLIVKNQDNTANFKIYKSIRTLRKEEPQYDFVNIQEMLTHYVTEDTGVIVIDVPVNTQVNFKYSHKISIFSKLFVPSKLPQSLVMAMFQKKPKNEDEVEPEEKQVKMTITVVNGSSGMQLQPFVKKIGNDQYEITEFVEDAKFSTTNWESSDDELGEA